MSPLVTEDFLLARERAAAQRQKFAIKFWLLGLAIPLSLFLAPWIGLTPNPKIPNARTIQIVFGFVTLVGVSIAPLLTYLDARNARATIREILARGPAQ